MNDKENELLHIAHLCLDLGAVNRLTEHPQGTKESVTTHSVMLGVLCCYLNEVLGLEMHSGLLAQFALVHDLHEAICGDESTLYQDPAKLKAKEDKELDAIEQLQQLPWIGWMSRLYHEQQYREARFVRGVDKLLPKLTHLLNDCIVLKREGMDGDSFHSAIMERQHESMSLYCEDLPELLELHRRFGSLVESRLRLAESTPNLMKLATRNDK